MSYTELMEEALPVAPLKIAALESCREMGQKVNDYIVQFRKDTKKESLDSPLFSHYQSDNYLVDCRCPRFGTGEAKGYDLRNRPWKRFICYGRRLQLQPYLYGQTDIPITCPRTTIIRI